MSTELGNLLEAIKDISGATLLGNKDDYCGYFIKYLVASDLPDIVQPSHVGHIAIANPAEGMLLFPFVTSSLYEWNSSKGIKTPKEKSRYPMLLPFDTPRESIVRCRQLTSSSWPKFPHKQNKVDFDAATKVLKADVENWKSGKVSAVIAIRTTTQQRQLEIGRSDDSNEWHLIWDSLSPEDALIFLQRENLTYDIFLVSSADTVAIKRLPDFWISDKNLPVPISLLRENQSNSRAVLKLDLPKPFILLAGISGTGKSRFVRDQAQKVRSPRSPNNYCSIPVRPDWHEPADLLGYISRIGGEKYVSTEFLKFIVAAWVDATNNDGELIKLEDMTPHWICLDEMNLAPVEQYFSDFLSVLETRQNDKNGTYHCDPLLRASELQSLTEESKNKLKDELFAQSVEVEKCKKLFDKFLIDPTWGGIPIPPNLIVAGTVNMDETAHGFSRKVIDRALTFDFQEFFPYEFSRYLKGHPTEIRPLSFPFAIDSREESVRAALNQTADCDGERTVQFIGDLNKVLKDSPFELAYRALNEAILSVACFARGATPANNSVGGSSSEDLITTAADAGQLNGGASGSGESPVETAPANDSITTAAGAGQPNGGASDGSESPDEFALLAAWDDFLMQKVLPRIEGDGAKLKALREIGKSEVKLPPQFGRDTILHQLYKLVGEKLKPIWGSESDDAYESTNAEPTRPDLLRLVEGRKVIPCRSRKKLRWMMQRLKANHFTDFWC